MTQKSTWSAARATATLFGVLAGLGGLTHGIGEVLQGNVRPKGILIESWTQGPIATNMGGEPGMTIVPNLRVTGVLTILASLAVIATALLVRDKKGGRRMILFSILMLLVGGGFGPPILGILAGVAGTGVGAPSAWWRTRPRAGTRRFLGMLWPWVFGISAANGLFLVVGSVILVYFFGVNNADLFTNSFYLSIGSLVLTILTGRAHDAQEPDKARLDLTL
ncbi:MAG TPA: hypothetical protein VLC95_01440 [Anaerolineae bacterium]|nr:hypothetical protein [Anaerolineae bacterium]